MPRKLPRQESGDESRAGLVGDAVPLNGVEDQAARRAHMLAQTTARQVAERTAARTASERRLNRTAREDSGRDREAMLQVELTRINAEDQTWRREHGLADPLVNELESSLPGDTMAPEGTMDRFMVILRMLQRGVTLRGWASLFSEVPNYAHVASRTHGLDLRPRRPIAFEGTVYDLEHPVSVGDDGSGIMRIVAGIETLE